MEKKRLLILVTNDDGVKAKGIKALVSLAKKFGDVIVVAPMGQRSGSAHSITVANGVKAKHIEIINGIKYYECSGTPVDCVKFAMSNVLNIKPDYILSGINHGSNASCNLLYSGTMGAAIEGCINGIPSIGFSLMDERTDADMSLAQKYCEIILEQAIEFGLPGSVCLNVNIPAVKDYEIKGIRVCRQTKGYWSESFEHKIDDIHFLKGTYINEEPNAVNTDIWATSNNYIAIVPIQVDMTAHNCLRIFANNFDCEMNF